VAAVPSGLSLTPLRIIKKKIIINYATAFSIAKDARRILKSH
jgi:hypothetical protein